jgi:WD40 repeat protein
MNDTYVCRGLMTFKTNEPVQIDYVDFLKHPGRIEYVFLNPEKRTVLAWSRITAFNSLKYKILEWNLQEKNIKTDFQGEFLKSSYIDLDPQKQLIVERKENIIKVWDLKSCNILSSFEANESKSPCVAITNSTNIIASSNSERKIDLWDWQKSELLHTFEGDLGRRSSIKDSSFKNQLVGFTDNGQNIKIWDLKSSRVIDTLEGHNSKISFIAINRNRNILASSDWSATVKIWDLLTGKVITINEDNLTPISSVAIIPNTKTIVLGNWNGTISLWNWQIKKKIFTIKKHKHRIRSIDINLVGNKMLMVTCGWDNSIIVWRIV